jgi:hypothetical protein
MGQISSVCSLQSAPPICREAAVKSIYGETGGSGSSSIAHGSARLDALVITFDRNQI